MSDSKFIGTNGIDMDELHKALNFIPVSTMNRDEWLRIGSALKFEGAPLDWFIEWSSTDSRPGYFSEENCRGRWESFRRTASERHTTARTIFYEARAAGYRSSAKAVERRPVPKIRDRDTWKPKLADVSGFQLSAEWFRNEDTRNEWNPAGELLQYIEAVFDPDDIINIVINADEKDGEPGKWRPKDNGRCFKCSALRSLLIEREKAGGDLEPIFGKFHPAAGVWIRINPTDGRGTSHDHTTAFRWCLVEFDDIGIVEQLRAFHELRLPVQIVVHSGGKSAHAIVHIDAEDEEEYKKRVLFLHQIMEKADRKCDPQNKNCNRLSRMPGAMRGDCRQYIIPFDADTSSWDEWAAYIEDMRNADGVGSLKYYPEDLTEAGDADLFVRMYGDRIRYSASIGWLVFDGKVWNEDDRAISRAIQSFTREMLTEAEEYLAKFDEAPARDPGLREASEFYKHAMKARSNRAISAIESLAASQVACSLDEFDADPYLLNTPAGVIDLRTGEMREHDPKYFCSKITDVAPGTAGAEEWAKFLTMIFSGDREVIDFVQQYIGLAAVGKVYEELFLMVTGSGGNGKSTTFNSIQRALGSYSGSLDIRALVDGGSNKGFLYARLRGKRFVITAELKEGARLDDGAMKHIVTGDRMTIEKKFKDEEEVEPTHTLLMYANHLPRITGVDEGIWRRIAVLEMLQKLTAAGNYDPKFGERLYQTCAPAIMAWIVEGSRKVIANGCKLRIPKAVAARTAAYRGREDALAEFFEDMCEVGAYNPTTKDFSEPASIMFGAYKDWCKVNNRQACNVQMFRSRMESAGFKQLKPHGIKFYTGIKLRHEARLVFDNEFTAAQMVEHALQKKSWEAEAAREARERMSGEQIPETDEEQDLDAYLRALAVPTVANTERKDVAARSGSLGAFQDAMDVEKKWRSQA